MASINTYLNFNGNTEEAFNFYKKVFGGEFTVLQRFKDIPEQGKIGKEDKDKIMHISLPIGKGTSIMGTDALESMGYTVKTGNNYYISLNAETKEEADKLFNGLSAGGKIEMPIQDVFWGSYYGSFVDKYGVQWMVNYDYKKS